MAKEKKIRKDYVNNEEFLKMLKEYQELNYDTSDWFLKKKIKNDSDENFVKYRKELLEQRKMLIDSESEDEKTDRIKKLDKLKNRLGRFFLLICDGILKKPNFINYDPLRKDTMISDGTYFMCIYIDRYDTTRSNPFAYFTQIAFNAFLQNINKTNKNMTKFTSLFYIENLDRSDNVIILDDWEC
jgi:hypothetical protein